VTMPRTSSAGALGPGGGSSRGAARAGGSSSRGSSSSISGITSSMVGSDRARYGGSGSGTSSHAATGTNRRPSDRRTTRTQGGKGDVGGSGEGSTDPQARRSAGSAPSPAKEHPSRSGHEAHAGRGVHTRRPW